MADFPSVTYGPPAIITPWNTMEAYGNIAGYGSFGVAASTAWGTNNDAHFYPFTLTAFTTVYQLYWYVGATQGGNIDVAVYDSQKNRIVSAGSTAMSASVNVVQALNVTDTVLPPGDYLMGGACSLSTGTCFAGGPADEIGLSAAPTYLQATALPLPDPCAPVLDTAATVRLWAFGAICTATF